MWDEYSKPYWHVSNVEVFHVMWALHVIVDCTSSRAAKCLNGVRFTFLRGHIEGRIVMKYCLWKLPSFSWIYRIILKRTTTKNTSRGTESKFNKNLKLSVAEKLMCSLLNSVLFVSCLAGLRWRFFISIGVGLLVTVPVVLADNAATPPVTAR